MSRDKLRDSRPTIGLLSEVGASGSSYYANLWAGFVSAAPELDVNLICYVGGTINVSQYGFDAQRNILYDLVSSERVDGLVICGALGNFMATEEFQSFVDRYRPLPMVGIAQTPGIPNVVVDNEKGVRDLVTHFIEVHGYRRIAFIRGPEGNREAELRYRAYVEALAEHGLPLDPDLVAPGAFVHQTGVEAIRLLLDERKAEVDAVVAANDWMALGALEALRERGIRVPQDIALTGFDDTREAAASRPSLTTVQQPIQQLGQAGIEVLLRLLAGEQVPEETILPTRLMVRQSCGCSEPAVAHAALGPLERNTEPFKQAVVAQREAILSEMMQVVKVSASSSSEWASRLLNAFVEEMVPGSAASEPARRPAPRAPFLSALDDVLRQAVAVGGQVDDWQETISVMRRHLLPYLTDVATLSRAEDLFSQGRVMIGKMAQWNRARHEVEEAQQTEIQGHLGGDLAAAVQTEQILDVLAHRLPQLGFSSFYLSFYDGQERPAPWSRLVLAHDGGERVKVGAGGRRFPTRRLLPDELFPQERRYTWVAESLNSRENQFGWIILEAGSQGGEIYGTLARQISGALQDSLLIQQLENRSVQLMTAAEVSRAASSVLDPDELIQQVVTLVRERFGLYYAGLFLVGYVPGAPGEWAVLRAGTGEAGQKMLEQGHRLAVGGASMIGWCIAHKQARIALDVGEEAVRFDNPLLPQTRSEMALPLMVGDRVLGALDVQSTRPMAFSEEDITVLQLVADQVAVAVDNARKFLEETTLLEATDPLFRASRRLAEASTVDEVAQSIIDAVVETEADGCTVASLTFSQEGEIEAATLLAHWKRHGTSEFPTGTAFAASISPDSLDMVTEFWTVEDLVQDTQMPAESRQFLAQFDSRALANVPLRAGDRVIGFVTIQRATPGPFSAVSIRLYETMADQAALALERARLFEEAQAQAERERVISQITTRMRSTLDMRTALRTAADEIYQTFDLDRIAIRLRIEDGDD
jgi:DNA-binding LacI/PurR family transcriptional regulator/GAF domain-containing protein